jgi:MarR family transcriptional regulator, 2-MHQ and catechol-resistance regulon repressor
VNAGELHRLARVLRLVATTATANPGEASVSAGDLAIVEDVAHHRGTSIGEIAERTGLAQSLVSTTVAKLREAGMVEVETDSSDRRRARIGVSAAARKLFAARSIRATEPAIRHAVPEATGDEIARIERLLEELASLVLR